MTWPQAAKPVRDSETVKEPWPELPSSDTSDSAHLHCFRNLSLLPALLEAASLQEAAMLVTCHTEK